MWRGGGGGLGRIYDCQNHYLDSIPLDSTSYWHKSVALWALYPHPDTKPDYDLRPDRQLREELFYWT